MEYNFFFAIVDEVSIKEEFLRWLFLLGSFVIVFFALKNENKYILITGLALTCFTGMVGFLIFYMLFYVYKLKKRI